MAALTGTTKLAGVMGWPISHSLSPKLHGYWLSHYGIDGAYMPLAVSPENFDGALRALPSLGFRGTNVTVPHKEAALKACDTIDEVARRIGAVNTIVVTEDGQLAGTNTDAFGFIENLKQGAPDFIAAHGPAVVLGAGGAARAVICALLDAGVPEVRLANRTRARADALAHDLDGPITVFDWEVCVDMLPGCSVLVNTTSLGMTGKAPLTLALDMLPGDAVVTDIVYAPLMTPLLIEAELRGNAVVDGLGMLLHQARPGFEAWFGLRPDVTEDLRTHMLEGL